jgi:hypothetical protein
MTATGIDVAPSAPAGTSRKPVAFWPGAAVAVPTVKLLCPSRQTGNSALRNNRQVIFECFMAVSSIS